MITTIRENATFIFLFVLLCTIGSFINTYSCVTDPLVHSLIVKLISWNVSLFTSLASLVMYLIMKGKL